MTLSDSPVAAVSDLHGNQLIAYVSDTANPTSSYPVKASLFAPDGSALESEFSVSDGGMQASNHLSVAYNSHSDEFLVAYSKSGVYLQRVRALDGELVGAAVKLVGDDDSQRRTPSVAYNPARDEFLVVYVHPSQVDIRGCIVDGSLITIGQEFTITAGNLFQTHAAAVAGPDEFLVVWRETTNPPGVFDVRARRVSDVGVPLGSQDGFYVAGAGSVLSHTSESVAYAGAGGYVVAWMWNTDGAGRWDVLARTVRPGQDGVMGTPFAPDSSTVVKSYPSVACSPAGDCLVSYLRNTSGDGATYEIWAKPARHNGQDVPAAGVERVCTLNAARRFCHADPADPAAL